MGDEKRPSASAVPRGLLRPLRHSSSTARCRQSSSSASEGPSGGLTFPLNGVLAALVLQPVRETGQGDFGASFSRSLMLGPDGDGDGGRGKSLLAGSPSVASSSAARRCILPRHRQPRSCRRSSSCARHRRAVPADRHPGRAWFGSGFGAHLTWTLPFGVLIMFAVFNRFSPGLRGGRARSRRLARGRPSGSVLPMIAPSLIGVGPLRLLAELRRVRPLAAHHGHVQHAAARDLRHDHQCHDAGALCAGHRDDDLLLPHHRRHRGAHRLHQPQAPDRPDAASSSSTPTPRPR